MSALLFPPLIDDLGEPVNPRSDDAIEAYEPGQSNAYATSALPPLGWNNGAPDGSRMIGWTLHQDGNIVAQHAFSINPQSITRNPSARNQMFATQAEFYVDAFGPGPDTIQLTQLVAHGRATAGGGGSLARATMREDVVRFYDVIFDQATANPGLYQVYFHDSHLWDQVDGRTPELVYFPDTRAFQIVRSVQLQNVWQLQLTMITLTPSAANGRTLTTVPGQPQVRVHVVRQGETLKRIATRLAGRDHSHKRVLALEHQIIALTRKYGKDDITKPRQVPAYSAANPQQWIGNVHVSRMHLGVGEKIILPAG